LLKNTSSGAFSTTDDRPLRYRELFRQEQTTRVMVGAMRWISFLALATALALASAPAAARSGALPVDSLPGRGPNAEAAQRPLGPNARATERPLGPNTRLIREGKEVYYSSCAAAGAVRSTPIRQGEAGYGRHLDRDGDGLACE
jgi:hypothetical protein